MVSAVESMAGKSTRTEKDSLGPVEVPSDKYWASQTQRCLENFVIGDLNLEKMPVEVVHALGDLKSACAMANKSMGRLSPEIADPIIQAAGEVSKGVLDEHFPLRVWQTGSGTQSNMNSNEVIAKRASQLKDKSESIPLTNSIHPNDHVNLGQSSNDVFPTAMHICIAKEYHNRLIPSLEKLAKSIEDKAAEYENIAKIGRTHLMDATPLTVGQEFSAWAYALRASQRRMEAETDIFLLAQGGTAVGTGLNTCVGFDEGVAKNLRESLKLPFKTHPNKFAALSFKDAAVNLSGELNTLATSCFKIANDVRLLGSGPRCGLGELSLPANEPGSSIMPGKVNPTQCEALTMVCAQVMGNHTTVSISATHGHLQLNVFKPVITANVLRSIRLLSDGMDSFRHSCMEGVEVNKDRIESLLNESLMLVTCLTSKIGYDKASKCALKAHKDGSNLIDVVVHQEKLLTEEEFRNTVDPRKMLTPMTEATFIA